MPAMSSPNSMAAAFADGEPKSMDGNAIMASLTEQPIFCPLCIVIRDLAIFSFDLGTLFLKKDGTFIPNQLTESQYYPYHSDNNYGDNS